MHKQHDREKHNRHVCFTKKVNSLQMTLWNSGVFACACLPGSYRFSEFRDSNVVGEGVAVACVVHQNTRQEHGAQVVSIQHIHGQSGCGCSPVGGVRSAVLEDGQMLSISALKKVPHD